MKETRKKKRSLNKYKSSDSPSKSCLPNSSYPFLTLLEDICLQIQNNNVEDDNDKDSIKLDRNCLTDIPLIDRTQYPFSSLLQKFIHEASLHKQTNSIKKENDDDDDSLFHDMNSSDLSIPHEKDKENLNVYDYSYSSRLKHMAYQSTKYEMSDDNVFQKDDSNSTSDIGYILQRAFPIKDQELGDMRYSKKLQNFSNVLQEQIKAEMILNPPNFSKQNYNINSSDFLKREEYPHYSIASTAQIKKENTSESPDMDGHLFGALMNNIHMQSMAGHNNNSDHKDLIVVKKEPMDNDLIDHDMSVVENLILHHFQKQNWGT